MNRKYAEYIIDALRKGGVRPELFSEVIDWLTDPENKRTVDETLKQHWHQIGYAETTRTYEAMASVRSELGLGPQSRRKGYRPEPEVLYDVMSDPMLNPGAIHYRHEPRPQRRNIRPRKRPISLKRRIGRIAAIFFPLAFIAGFAWLQLNDKTTDSGIITYTTGMAEHKRVLLPDSTEVMLNANSTLAYTGHRHTTLSGEAHFKVKSNPQDPFYLATEAVDVKVTGTEFNIEAYPGSSNTTVELFEGRLELTAGGTTQRVREGSQYRYDHTTNEIARSSTESTVPKWIGKALSSEKRTLPEIFNLVGWYYTVHIKTEGAIDSTSIYGLGLTGEETINDILYMLRSVSEYAFTYEIESDTVTIRAN